MRPVSSRQAMQTRDRLAVGSEISFEDLPVGDRLAAAFAHRHLVPGLGMPVDRLVDGALRPVGDAPDESEIAAPQRALAPVIGKLGRQCSVGAVGFRDHQQAGGVLVEAMYDPGPPDAADAREAVAAMGDERVDQRPGPVAGGGVDHEPAGLVDDDDRSVLVDDVERDRLRPGLRRLGGRHLQGDRVAGVDVVAGIADRAAVDGDRGRRG